MMPIIGYVLLGVFLWSFSGILLGLLMLISKEQRKFVKVKLKEEPDYLQNTFYGLALFGPICYILAIVYHVKQFVRERIGY